jgi:hypothetical protein
MGNTPELYLLKKEEKRPEGLSGSTSFSRKPSGRRVLIPKILRRYPEFFFEWHFYTFGIMINENPGGSPCEI